MTKTGFPTLTEHQVAVVMADGATGHILNEKGEIYRNDSHDNYYLIFDDIGTSREFIKNKSELNPKVEFVIYNRHNEALDHVKAKF